MRKVQLFIVIILVLLTACSAKDSINTESPVPMDLDQIQGIPNSKIEDIQEKLNENLGIPKSEMKYTSPESQNTYSYNFELDENSNLIEAAFLISYGKTQMENEFLMDVKEYFSLCAQLPYDTSDFDSAINFIEENIPSNTNSELSKEAFKVTKTFGDAKFTVSGTSVDNNYTLFTLIIYTKSLSAS